MVEFLAALWQTQPFSFYSDQHYQQPTTKREFIHNGADRETVAGLGHPGNLPGGACNPCTKAESSVAPLVLNRPVAICCTSPPSLTPISFHILNYSKKFIFQGNFMLSGGHMSASKRTIQNADVVIILKLLHCAFNM